MDVIHEDPVQEGLGTEFKKKRDYTSDPSGMMPAVCFSFDSNFPDTFH